jgi:hypothetical protein
MAQSLLDKRWLVLLGTIPVVIFAALFGMAMPADILSPLIAENGPFEVASVIMHLMVGALALYYWRKGYSIAGLLFLASILMAAREADLHKAFTTFGIFKTRQYVDASVPLMEKFISLGVVLSLLGAMGLLIYRARKDIGQLLRLRDAAIFGLMSLPLYLVVLKEIDGAPRMLRKAGMALSQREGLISRSIEEVGEAFIPVFVLIVLLQLIRRLPFSRPATE